MASSLFKDFERGTNPAVPGQIANTCFYSPTELRNKSSLKHREGKIFLGLIDAEIAPKTDSKTGQKVFRATAGKSLGWGDDRHMVTVAGSRSGKGVAAIIPNLLSYNGSVLAIDPKAELASMTARFRAEKLGQQVHVIDPFRKAGNKAVDYLATYNPMDILRLGSQTLVEDAGLIADALIIRDTHGDSHWDESAKSVLEGLILHVASHSKYHNHRNLCTVYKLAMNLLSDKELRAEMLKNPNPRVSVRELMGAFFEKEDKERNSVLSTLRRHIRFLGYQSMQNVLERSSFDLSDIKKKKMTIYLCLPAMRLGTCSRWFRLFVNLVLTRMEETPQKPDPPVLLCLDEFASLGHMQTIEDAAGQIAGFGCRLWPILQDLGQLETLYKDRWQTFMANAGMLQFFGNSDMKTLEWVSSRLGQTRVIQENHNELTIKERGPGSTTGVSHSIQNHPLMPPEEIARFFGRDDPLQRQLIIIAGEAPIVMQRVCYFEDSRFKDFAEPPLT